MSCFGAFLIVRMLSCRIRSLTVVLCNRGRWVAEPGRCLAVLLTRNPWWFVVMLMYRSLCIRWLLIDMIRD